MEGELPQTFKKPASMLTANQQLAELGGEEGFEFCFGVGMLGVEGVRDCSEGRKAEWAHVVFGECLHKEGTIASQQGPNCLLVLRFLGTG